VKSLSSDKKVVKNPETCPGLRDLLQPKPAYINCHVCGGELEIWSDEDKTTCPGCGAEWKRPDPSAACLTYCQFADKCRGIIESRKK
jgi:Zn finger protein HypA/HybF involved in hydrogenase expression